MGWCAVWCGLSAGCRQWFIDGADREVAALIEQRQRAALGLTANASIGAESGALGGGADMYRFVPSPTDSVVPESFRRATMVGGTEAGNGEGVEGVGQSESGPAETEGTERAEREVRRLGLAEALAYSFRHSRQYQSEKERLYLAALRLTLERYMWTPRFVESVLGVDYENLGQANDFDQSLSLVSRFAVEQRLPYGGEVTARVINTLVRDVGASVTTGETGQVILDTRFPLLRGAGRVAYESRYESEREFVYSVRSFERFRRRFVVRVAADFFDLLSVKAQIVSAESQATALSGVYDREQALASAGRKLQIEADRARVSMLNARNRVVNAGESYETALDAFKILIGMPTAEPIDAEEQEGDVVLTDPEVPLEEAVEVALRYRLDLLTARDVVDDARRDVEINRNNLLPQIDFNASVRFDTDPDRRRSTSFDTERTTWGASLDFEIPLERKRERNEYRAGLIGLRQAERDYEEFADTVRLEVRRAMRRLVQTRSTIDIQEAQIRINEFRTAEARAKLKLGRLASNRDVVDAEGDLAQARDDYAAAKSDFRRAVLEFLRDTGTLRVGEDGKWLSYEQAAGGTG